MAYVTRKEFEKRIHPDLLRRSFDVIQDGFLEDERINALLDDASAELDTYLYPIYVLPIETPYPVSIKALTIELAFSILARTHRDLFSQDSQTYEKLYEKLQLIRLGRLNLGLTKIKHNRILMTSIDPEKELTTSHFAIQGIKGF